MTTPMDERLLTDRYFAFLLDAYRRYDREGSAIRSPLVWPWVRRFGHQPRLAILRNAAKALNGNRPGGALIAEFGVYKGTTINYLARQLPDATIYGFDSFRGFPDDGRSDWKMDFSVGAKPVVPGNVTLVEGMFDATLPGFAASLAPGRTIDFLHVDCDIYSSTKCIFDALGDRIVDGTIIVFDELLHYSTSFENEFLAFFELLEQRGLDFRWLARAGRLRPLADELKAPLGGGMRVYRRSGHFQNAAVVVCRDPGRDARLSAVADEAAGLAALYQARPRRRKRKAIAVPSQPAPSGSR